MSRVWRWGLLSGLLGGCAGGLDWNWPLVHLAGGVVLGAALFYGAFRLAQHQLREDRRARRDERRD